MKPFRSAALSLAALVALPSQALRAQDYGCESRMVEKALDGNLTRRFGPTAEQQLQAMAAGQFNGVKMTFDRISVQTLGSQPGITNCAARVRIWREDTGATAEHDVQYSIIVQGGQTIVRLK